MAHVDNVTVSCIDFRFRPKVAEWIKGELNDESDIVALAGVSKAILDEDTRALVLKQLSLAHQLHEVKTIHLIDHIDCGAYGGSAKFDGDKDAEVAMHNEELAKAADLVKEAVHGVDVQTHIIDFEGMI